MPSLPIVEDSSAIAFHSVRGVFGYDVNFFWRPASSAQNASSLSVLPIGSNRPTARRFSFLTVPLCANVQLWFYSLRTNGWVFASVT